MKDGYLRVAVVFAAIFFIPLIPALSHAAPEGGGIAEGVRLSGQGTGAEAVLSSLERAHIVNDIYEYTAIVKVGPGEFDKIGIHRIVREKAPWVPLRSDKAVMLVHGDASNFRSAFLASTLSAQASSDRSLGNFLAENGIDVWGIDRRWAFVPDSTIDFTFMKDWDTALHLKDLKLAVKIARAVRGLNGDGFGKIIMLGHSRGAQLTYAYANEETRLPEWQRDLKGMIPIEMAYKFSPEHEALRQAAYKRYQMLKALHDSGVYYTGEAAGLKYLAFLAATDPDTQSKIMPGLTNKQAALFVLTATYATVIPPEKPNVPFYHYLAGTFDQYGFPAGLQFANLGFVADIALSIPSYMSLGEAIDGEALMSDAVEAPYDDHLGEITIPVFYVGAAGGFGEYGEYTTTLLGGADKNTLIVQLYSSEAAALDYGHADVLWADNARSLVWEPVYSWIRSH